MMYTVLIAQFFYAIDGSPDFIYDYNSDINLYHSLSKFSKQQTDNNFLI